MKRIKLARSRDRSADVPSQHVRAVAVVATAPYGAKQLLAVGWILLAWLIGTIFFEMDVVGAEPSSNRILVTNSHEGTANFRPFVAPDSILKQWNERTTDYAITHAGIPEFDRVQRESARRSFYESVIAEESKKSPTRTAYGTSVVAPSATTDMAPSSVRVQNQPAAFTTSTSHGSSVIAPAGAQDSTPASTSHGSSVIAPAAAQEPTPAMPHETEGESEFTADPGYGTAVVAPVTTRDMASLSIPVAEEPASALELAVVEVEDHPSPSYQTIRQAIHESNDHASGELVSLVAHSFSEWMTPIHVQSTGAIQSPSDHGSSKVDFVESDTQTHTAPPQEMETDVAQSVVSTEPSTGESQNPKPPRIETAQIHAQRPSGKITRVHRAAPKLLDVPPYSVVDRVEKPTDTQKFERFDAPVATLETVIVSSEVEGETGQTPDTQWIEKDVASAKAVLASEVAQQGEDDPQRMPVVADLPSAQHSQAVTTPEAAEMFQERSAVVAPVANPVVTPEVTPQGETKLAAAKWPFVDRATIEPTQGVTLNVDNADVRSVFEMLARGYQMNILVAPDVEGVVTANVDGLTPDQALNGIVKMCNLSMQRDGDLIYIYPPEKIPADARLLRTFPLDFARAATLEPTIQGLLSPVGNAYAHQIDVTDNLQTQESIVVVDIPAVIAQVESFILQADRAPRQVMIEAHVLEVELTDDMLHGVNFEAILSGDFKVGAVGLADPISPTPNPLFFAQVNGDDVTALLTLIETTTDSKTLASPRVQVINGQNARIQVGQQLGFQVATVTETSTIQDVQLLETGVVLSVTPTISRDGRILMLVKPEVSDGEINPATKLPEKETREVETSVLLNNHQGVIIGGLIQERDRTVIKKLPWLGDVRRVGKLFQRREAVRSRTEIIVALVPHIVEPGVQDERCLVDYERASTPLFQGSLERNCRPLEGRLPDTAGDECHKYPEIINRVVP